MSKTEMKVHCAHTELVDVLQVVENRRNPNVHPESQVKLLAKILRLEGWHHPIIVSKRSGFIVAGHGRLQAAKLNGWEKVPVDYQDFESEAAEYAFMVADNALAELSEMDKLKIGDEVLKLGGDFDLDLLGIPDFELPRTESLDAQTDPDDVPEKVIPKAKLGDLFVLGAHRLICGDSTSPEVVTRLMGGDKAHLVFTDPPYGVSLGHNESAEAAAARNRRTDGKIVSNDELTEDKLEEFLIKVFNNAMASVHEGSAIYVFHADSQGLWFRQAMLKSGWLLKQCLIWVKQQFVMSRQDYHWAHEPCLYGWSPGAAHRWFGDRKQSTTWMYDRPKKSPEHPTMKPTELVEKALLNSSDIGHGVLDLFGGSGTTLIACEKNARKCFMVELAPEYVSTIIERWQAFTGRAAFLQLPDGAMKPYAEIS